MVMKCKLSAFLAYVFLTVVGGPGVGIGTLAAQESAPQKTLLGYELPQQPPGAVNDIDFSVLSGASLTVPERPEDLNHNLLNNDCLGTPVATLVSFGGGALGGAVTDHAAGATVGVGTGSLTVDAQGRFTFTPDAEFLGEFAFEYRIASAVGTSDALVSIDVQEPPAAIGDLGFVVRSGAILAVLDQTVGLLANDARGAPQATLTSFGGGSLGGAITEYGAGEIVPVGTGWLTVNPDGTFYFAPPAGFVGTFIFQYELANSAGASDATAMIDVQPDLPPSPMGPGWKYHPVGPNTYVRKPPKMYVRTPPMTYVRKPPKMYARKPPKMYVRNPHEWH